MDININIDLIKHKKHEHDKEFDEKKDPNIYYDHFEGHRNIINQINLKQYKRHYVQVHQEDLKPFVGLYEYSQDLPYFLQHENIKHNTKPLVFITDRNIHPDNVPKNIEYLHIIDCEHILENTELIQKCCQSKKKIYPFTLNIILYTELCSKLHNVIQSKLNMIKNYKNNSKQLFIIEKIIYVN